METGTSCLCVNLIMLRKIFCRAGLLGNHDNTPASQCRMDGKLCRGYIKAAPPSKIHGSLGCCYWAAGKAILYLIAGMQESLSGSP